MAAEPAYRQSPGPFGAGESMWPGLMPPPPAAGWNVAVINAALRPGRPAVTSPPSDVGLSADARWLTRRTGLATTALRVTSATSDELAATLHRLPAATGAVFLTGAPLLVTEVQNLVHERGGQPLITEDDATAITLTAATLSYLHQRDTPRRATRVVILGSESAGVFCSLLLAVGLVDITLWNPHNHVPLGRLCRDADVVVSTLHRHHDGTDHLASRLAADRPTGSVIWLGRDQHPEHERLLALPGLFRAIAASIGARVDIHAYAACAHGLTRATPPGWSLPNPHDPALTWQVANAAFPMVDPADPRRRSR